MTRITVATGWFTSRIMFGRATPTSRAVRASRKRASGTCRRHELVDSTTLASTSRFVKRTAYRLRRRPT